MYNILCMANPFHYLKTTCDLTRESYQLLLRPAVICVGSSLDLVMECCWVNVKKEIQINIAVR